MLLSIYISFLVFGLKGVIGSFDEGAFKMHDETIQS